MWSELPDAVVELIVSNLLPAAALPSLALVEFQSSNAVLADAGFLRLQAGMRVREKLLPESSTLFCFYSRPMLLLSREEKIRFH